MAYLHCRKWIQVPTRILNPMATLYYAEQVYIVRTRIQIIIWSQNIM